MEIKSITRRNGVAGQIAVTAIVQWPDETQTSATFVGSIYGGRPVLVLPSGIETFVSAECNARCGDFSADPKQWVREFFGNESRSRERH